ncbi:hypothetical protein LguiA_006030 [Lonicera macranthoides]
MRKKMKNPHLPFLSLQSPPLLQYPSIPEFRLGPWLRDVKRMQRYMFRVHVSTCTSGYLKRHLTESSEITLSPPLNITPETFSLVADFCYGTHLVVTPLNIAALRTAAEILEMTETNGNGEENLRQKTEAYFRRAVTVNREYASTVLRSCLSSLPEAETTAFLMSRCIEALSLAGDGDDIMNCLGDVRTVRPKDFQLIVESMHRRMTGSHDLLYKIVDLYLKEHNGKISEEEKTRICNYIDCTTLSPQLLMHAVQNPKMPLRFIVQAMFLEQLNTRRSLFSAAATHLNTTTSRHKNHHHQPKAPHDNITLGAILQRDAALRQVAELQATMHATSSRVQALEKELIGMRQVLDDPAINGSDPGRSASFRFSSEGKVERGERGSVSSGSFRGFGRKERTKASFYTQGFSDGNSKVERKFGKRVLDGLKSVFRVSNFGNEKNCERKVDGNGNGNGDVTVIRKDLRFDGLSPSLV